ncbi:phage baseplate assembly protein V [Alcaligenaceae bacterium]|nr:phage baseplate assembly protein V [Alcaligenaceae bacterium]
MGITLETGIVTGVDYQACRVRVRLDDRDGVETYWLDVPQRNTQGTQRRPVLYEIGEQVRVLLDEDGVEGVVLGGVYSSAEPPPVADETTDYVRFRDGTSVIYDMAGGELEVNVVRTVRVVAAESVHVTAGTDATVDTPELKITGNTTIEKKLTVKGGMAISGGGGQAAVIEGNVEVKGNVHGTGSILADGANSNHHSH